MQKDESGGCDNEIRADLFTGRRFEAQFQSSDRRFHPWLLGRRTALARGIIIAGRRMRGVRIPSSIQVAVRYARGLRR